VTQFILNIELGNEAMQHPQDVAIALRRVGQVLDLDAFDWGPPQEQWALIRDSNGNTVGRWSLVEDPT
jgi:hypothetical protein